MLANRSYINSVIDVGRLAQLVRATGLHPVGWGFESLTAHHINCIKLEHFAWLESLFGSVVWLCIIRTIPALGVI